MHQFRRSGVIVKVDLQSCFYNLKKNINKGIKLPFVYIKILEFKHGIQLVVIGTIRYSRIETTIIWGCGIVILSSFL